MSRRANPTLIGIFVLGAVILGIITVLLLAGGQWFRQRHLHTMYFEGGAQGLQVGAPVVFLGVPVGTVKRIDLGIDDKSRRFLVAVTAEIESSEVKTREGQPIDLKDRKTIKELVAKGLRAQLHMQSMLTGLLYVDLNFHPDRPATFFASDPTVSEIPTIPATMDELTAKLEKFPMDKFLKELATIGESINKIPASKSIQELPLLLETTLRHLQSLAIKLDAASDPILKSVQTDLVGIQKTLTTVQSASNRIGSAADRVNTAADHIGRLVDPDSELIHNVNRASGELAAAAQAIQGMTAEESPTSQHLSSALLEVGRAARALRLLAETLEQQPEAILRGKREEVKE